MSIHPAILRRRRFSGGSGIINLLSNGTFDTTDDWFLGTNWSIAGGVAHSGGSNNLAALSQTLNPTLVSGQSYKIIYTVSNYVSGTIRPQISGSGAVTGTSRTANGTYEDTLVAVGAHSSCVLLAIGGTGIECDIDNVSLELL